MHVRYRAMLEQDLDAVVAIEGTAHESPWTRGNFLDSLKAGHPAEVMLNDGALVGYAVLMALPLGKVDGHDAIATIEAELLNITIAPTAQRRGLGRQLLSHLCEQVRAQGGQRLFLEVRASNAPARSLYVRQGFVETGLRRGYYACHDGTREDAILMELAL